MDFLKRLYFNCRIGFHALFFGMKVADNLLRANKNVYDTSIGTEHCIGIESIWAQLLRGELTEQVKQLRYSIYKINEEADRYKYIGNGVCVKKEAKTRNKPVITQEQREDTQNYTWALGKIDGIDQQSMKNFVGIKAKKLINLQYKNFPNLQFNDNIRKLKIDKKHNTAVLYMAMDIGYTPKSKRIARYLEDSISAYEQLADKRTQMNFLTKNSLCGNIDSITMKTYKCDGEYDDNVYRMDGVYPVGMNRNKDDKYTLDIELRFNKLYIDKFFSLEQVYNQEQQNRYDKKEKKGDTCIEYADAICLMYNTDEINLDSLRNLELTDIQFDLSAMDAN